MSDPYTPRRFFDEWLHGRLMVINETSHDLTNDYERLLPRAREAAEFLGLTWSNDLMPSYVHDSIEFRRDHL